MSSSNPLMPTAFAFAQPVAQSVTGEEVPRTPLVLQEHPDWVLPVKLDYVLSHYLLHRDPGLEFFFIQIGAFDGVSWDSIYPFVKRYGWSGVLVEPQGRYFAQLQQNYAGSEGLKFLNAAIAKERGSKTLYTMRNPEDAALPDWAPGIASFSQETVLKHQAYFPELAAHIQEEVVECITFADLLDAAGTNSIDLLQIDVEGFDYELLQLIDWNRIRPEIVRFEHKHLSEADHNAAIQLLGAQGYRIHLEVYDTLAYLNSCFADS